MNDEFSSGYTAFAYDDGTLLDGYNMAGPNMRPNNLLLIPIAR